VDAEVTSPSRAILELAASMEIGELEHVIAEAHFRKLASEAELRDQIARNPGKRGVARLRATCSRPAAIRSAIWWRVTPAATSCHRATAPRCRPARVEITWSANRVED
jgi:hypothetical protein